MAGVELAGQLNKSQHFKVKLRNNSFKIICYCYVFNQIMVCLFHDF